MKITYCNYYKQMVEAAGIEPASENNWQWLLHTYPEILILPECLLQDGYFPV